MDRIEGQPVEQLAARAQLRGVRLPGGDRVRVVEAYRARQSRPETFHVGLAEHLHCLTLGRVRGDRPVHRPLRLRLQLSLRGLDRPGLADTGLVEVGEQLGLRVAGDHDQRPAVGERLGPRHDPGRRPGQGLFVDVLDERASDVLVDVPDVDEPRAGGVARPRQGAGEGGMLDERGHVDRLAGLHVGADARDQLGVAVDAIHRGLNITCRG